MAQTNANDFVEELMNFNPQDLSVFQEKPKAEFDKNIYKTNPVKFSKSEDGHYRSKVRVVYNPFDIKQSVVHVVKYAMSDVDGFFMAPSKLSNGDKTCPIFTAWKKCWFSKEKPEDERKAFCKEVFNQTDENYVLVQVLEDENQPELVGKFLAMKLPKDVKTVMDAKMNPSTESKKKPVAIMDYLFGKPLEIDVTPGPDDPKQPQRKQREISYSLCAFADDSEPIIKVDGTPLFTEEELQTIEDYSEAKAKYEKAKTEADKKKKLEEAQALVPQVKLLYNKALDYMKENALDIVEECGYKEWNETLSARVSRYLEAAVKFIDPKTYVSDNPLLSAETPAQQKAAAESMQPEINVGGETEDLPF